MGDKILTRINIGAKIIQTKKVGISMKLSTKGRYGLRVMYFLAIDPEHVNVLSELSKQTGVNAPYMEKILGILKRKKLVKTVRGANGGYMIARDPKDITIGEILRALEGNLYLADCNSGECTKNCPTKRIFEYIYREINELLDKKSLYEMVLGESNNEESISR